MVSEIDGQRFLEESAWIIQLFLVAVLGLVIGKF